MKKSLFAPLLALALFTACDKENDDSNGDNNGNNNPEGVAATLQSGSWVITSYFEEFPCAERPEARERDFVDEIICLSSFTASPDPCSFGELCEDEREWDAYTIDFSSNTFDATMISKAVTIDVINTTSCTVTYSNPQNTTQTYNGPWAYSESENSLQINFGDVYDFYGGQAFITDWPYNIESISNNKIVLKHTITEDTCSLTREIVLELQ